MSSDDFHDAERRSYATPRVEVVMACLCSRPQTHDEVVRNQVVRYDMERRKMVSLGIGIRTGRHSTGPCPWRNRAVRSCENCATRGAWIFATPRADGYSWALRQVPDSFPRFKCMCPGPGEMTETEVSMLEVPHRVRLARRVTLPRLSCFLPSRQSSNGSSPP